MNYDEYVELQTSSPIKKPKRYRDGQRRAIEWFFKDVPKHKRILDIGCGLGIGIQRLKSMGFNKVRGIDLHPKNVEICLRKGMDVVCGRADIVFFQDRFYDVFWVSHSFEHMLFPTLALGHWKPSADINAKFFFVLPYPDLDPAPAHTASKEIGLNIDDEGVTLVKWFEDQGLELIEKKFDNFREKEIWLKFKKI